MADDWAKFYPIEKIKQWWRNEELTPVELMELTPFNFNLFCETILNFPYRFSPNQTLIGETFFNPNNRYDELWEVCGRKSAKTDRAAAITLFQVYRLLNLPESPQKFFGMPAGKPIFAINIGTSKDEALGVAFNTIKGLAEHSWYLSKYIKNTTKEEIEFPYKIIVHCQTSSSRAVRGFGNIVNLYDELAHFIDTRGNLSGSEVYEANHPNLDPCRVPEDSKYFPMAISVAISSPGGMQGIFWENFKTGKPVRVIQKTHEHGQHSWRATFQFATWEMNSKLPFESSIMQKELKRNEEKFWMERGAKFCRVIQPALPREAIYLCAGGYSYQEGNKQIGETSEDKKTQRIIALDPALTGDSYGLAMGHITDEKIIIDLVKYWEAKSRDYPVKIEIVENNVRNLCKRFNIKLILLDQYQSASTIQRLRKEGLPVYKVPPKGVGASKFNQIAYDYFTDRIKNLTIEYPYYSRLLDELSFLQRKELSNSVRYEAAVGYHDDLSDCIARICYFLEKYGRRKIHVG